MRRISSKTAARNAEVAPVRDQLRIGACDWCASDRHGLVLHEIANGPVRSAALDCPFAVVRLCCRCHQDLHELPKRHAVCIGLALIHYLRPEDYSLARFYRLTRRNWPDEAEVEIWYERILNGRSKRLSFVPNS